MLADDINVVVESWKKLLPMGIKRVHPAHGKDFPVGSDAQGNREFQKIKSGWS
jgi:hypothetical protein